jgi:hypothetical protein
MDQVKRMLCFAASGVLAACTASAYDLNLGKNQTMTFHGFLSQGYLLSSDYNYLGQTTDGGSFKFTEAGLNASFNPLPRTRITAQGFLFNIGENTGEYDVVLDFASVEYTFNDVLGVRAGRIRRPEGIYNHVQDVDMARTFILLPQGLYDARWRDFYVSMDGGSLFGTIPLSRAGSLSYEGYFGYLNPTMNGGMASVLGNNLPPNVRLMSIDSCLQGGGQLWWNTPADGLRIGAAGGYNIGFWAHQRVTINTPGGPVYVYPNGKEDIMFLHGSIEYCWRSWTFQAEYFTYLLYPEVPTATLPQKQVDAWYVSTAYRFNKRFEAGAYYTEYCNDTAKRDNSMLCQRDAALALRFDLTDWWIFKVEGHYIRGTGLLQDNASNPVQTGDGWWMFAAKTTFSF